MNLEGGERGSRPQVWHQFKQDDPHDSDLTVCGLTMTFLLLKSNDAWVKAGWDLPERELRCVDCWPAQPSWRPVEPVLEVETGLTWWIVDIMIGMGCVLLESERCRDRREAPQGEWLLIRLEDLKPRWTQVCPLCKHHLREHVAAPKNDQRGGCFCICDWQPVMFSTEPWPEPALEVAGHWTDEIAMEVAGTGYEVRVDWEDKEQALEPIGVHACCGSSERCWACADNEELAEIMARAFRVLVVLEENRT